MERGAPRSSLDRGYLAGLAGVLSLEAAGVVYQLLTGIPVPIITMASAALVVACMLRIHGLRGTMAFIVLVFAIPFGSEFLGVLTGFPYGAYAYSALVGPRLFDLVPIFIFIAWINIAYLAMATTTLAVGRSSYWLAPLDGILAVSWDAMVDPLAARAGFWTWLAPGGLYGVPWTNFLGWFAVVTIASLCIRAVWARDITSRRPSSRTLDVIAPGLLLGSAISFATLAVASGLLLSAAIGLGVLVLSVAIAWSRVARLPAGVAARSPWAPAVRAPQNTSRSEEQV